MKLSQPIIIALVVVAAIIGWIVYRRMHPTPLSLAKAMSHPMAMSMPDPRFPHGPMGDSMDSLPPFHYPPGTHNLHDYPYPSPQDDMDLTDAHANEEDYSYSFGFPTWGEYNNPYIRGYPVYGPDVSPPFWPRYRRYRRRWWW